MSDLDPELTELFRDETTQRLDEMDAALLAIESGDATADVVDDLFRHAHTIKGAAGMVGLDDVRALAHAVEDVLAALRETGAVPPALAGPLLRATGALRAHVAGNGEPIADLLEELAGGRAAPPPTAFEHAIPGTPPRTRSSQPGAPGGRPGTPGAQPETRPGPPGPQPRRGAQERPTVRVPADKIDHLIDVVGEVMQDRRRLAHSIGAQSGLSEEVADQLGAGDGMLDALKESAVGMRTLPLGAITGPLPRAVRDLAREAGKDVQFAVTGAGTELDRVILESLTEPLTHLLRNSVTHGIESPADRERAGKPVTGRVELRAVPRGSRVEIVVADDGRGVSPDVIEQARGEGSLGEILARPGFSTAAEVSYLAGRGVGLDAVKTHVESLGGTFEIRSQPGRGMEVVLLLPLALALVNVLLFTRGGSVFGVPIAAVEEVVTVAPTLSLEGRLALNVRGRPLPVADAASLVGAAAPALGARPPGLVVYASGRRAVVACDELLGEEEAVVKPLGPLLAAAHGYLGAAILGDGRIALLLEPASLTRECRSPAGRQSLGRAGAAADSAPKVLVVEDSFTVRELQRSILEAAGYRVVTARDGRDALAVLGREPDITLVLSDLEMPGLDGLALTRSIRADPARSSLPVVIVTSRASGEDRRKGIEAGADAYMAKQAFDQQALLGCVERLVGRPGVSSQAAGG